MHNTLAKAGTVVYKFRGLEQLKLEILGSREIMYNREENCHLVVQLKCYPEEKYYPLVSLLFSALNQRVDVLVLVRSWTKKFVVCFLQMQQLSKKNTKVMNQRSKHRY